MSVTPLRVLELLAGGEKRCAVESGSFRLVSLLLEHGVHPDIADGNHHM